MKTSTIFQKLICLRIVRKRSFLFWATFWIFSSTWLMLIWRPERLNTSLWNNLVTAFRKVKVNRISYNVICKLDVRFEGFVKPQPQLIKLFINIIRLCIWSTHLRKKTWSSHRVGIYSDTIIGLWRKKSNWLLMCPLLSLILLYTFNVLRKWLHWNIIKVREMIHGFIFV